MKKRFLVSLAVGLVCLYLALRGVHWGQVSQAFRELRWIPVFCALPFMLGTHFFRALRWKRLLKPVKNLHLFELFVINAVGFLAIFSFPMRLGEAARPLLLKRRHEVPFTTGLATIAVERIFDGLAASLALAVGLSFSSIQSQEIPGLGIDARMMSKMALAIIIPLLAGLIFVVLQQKRALRFAKWCISFLPEKFQMRLGLLVENFFVGLHALPDVWGIIVLLVQSLGVWISLAVTYWLGFVAFGLSLPVSAAFAVMGIGAVGVIIPGPPGFVGTFQIFIVAAMGLYGIEKSVGLTYSFVMHAINLFYTVGMGLLCVPFVSMRVKTLYEEASSERVST